MFSSWAAAVVVAVLSLAAVVLGVILPCQMLTSRLGLRLSSWVLVVAVVPTRTQPKQTAAMVLRQESGHIMAWAVALAPARLAAQGIRHMVLLEVREVPVVVTAQAHPVAPEFPVKDQQAEQVPQVLAKVAAAVAVQAR